LLERHRRQLRRYIHPPGRAHDGAPLRALHFLGMQIQARDNSGMSATVKAHGMDGTLVEPDWPPFTLAEVRGLLAQFDGLGEPLEILSISPRPLSAAGVLNTSSGRVFIKRHHRSVRDVEGLLEEHRFLAYLHGAGAQVPRVFTAVSGQTAIEIGEWTYEVHETPDGIDLYQDAISWTPLPPPAPPPPHARGRGARARLFSSRFVLAAP